MSETKFAPKFQLLLGVWEGVEERPGPFQVLLLPYFAFFIVYFLSCYFPPFSCYHIVASIKFMWSEGVVIVLSLSPLKSKHIKKLKLNMFFINSFISKFPWYILLFVMMTFFLCVVQRRKEKTYHTRFQVRTRLQQQRSDASSRQQRSDAGTTQSSALILVKRKIPHHGLWYIFSCSCILYFLRDCLSSFTGPSSSFLFLLPFSSFLFLSFLHSPPSLPSFFLSHLPPPFLSHQFSWQLFVGFLQSGIISSFFISPIFLPLCQQIFDHLVRTRMECVLIHVSKQWLSFLNEKKILWKKVSF